MALHKQIILESGVQVCYHRVASLITITNVKNVIEVSSYTSSEKRAEERSSLMDGVGMNVFVNTSIFETDYDQTMTIEDAYNYIKSLPDFYGSSDV